MSRPRHLVTIGMHGTKKLEVDLGSLRDIELVRELLARGRITHREARAIHKKRDIADLYACDCEPIATRHCACPYKGDPSEIRCLIQRGDGAEALHQIERMHPDFDGLGRLVNGRA